MRRPQTQHKRPNVITTLFIIIEVLNAKGRRTAEVNRDGPQRKFGMNMDREAVIGSSANRILYLITADE